MIFNIILDDKINEQAFFTTNNLEVHYSKHVLLDGEKADIDVRGLPYKNKDAKKSYTQRVINRIEKEDYEARAISLADTVATDILFPVSELEPGKIFLGTDGGNNRDQEFVKLRFVNEPIVFTPDETSDGSEHSLPNYVECVSYVVRNKTIDTYNYLSPQKKKNFNAYRYIKTYYIMSPNDKHLDTIAKRCCFNPENRDTIPRFELDADYGNKVLTQFRDYINPQKEEEGSKELVNKLRLLIRQFLDNYKLSDKQSLNQQLKKNVKQSKKQINDFITKHPELQELMNDPVGNKLANQDDNFLDKFNLITEQLKRKDNIKKQIKEALINRKK